MVAHNPIGQGSHPVLTRLEASQDKWSPISSVVDVAEMGGTDTPFSPPNRNIAKTMALQYWPEIQRKISIGMSGKEVQWQFALGHVGHKRFDPLRCRSGRSPYLETFINGLDSQCGFLVEAEILFARTGPKDLQVCFVPHLEGPAGNRFETIMIDQMRGELSIQLSPFGPILGR